MKHTEKITIYIGLNDQNGSTIETDDALNVIVKQLSKVTDGFNIVQGFGYWMGSSERTLIASFINIAGSSTKDVQNAIEGIRSALDQEAVLIEYTTVSYDMIERTELLTTK